MTGRMRYTSGATGEVIELDGPITYVGVASGIRSRRWSYELEGFDISQVVRRAREEDITCTTTTVEADRMSRIFDADIGAQKPGTLESDGWTQRCYIPETTIDSLALGKCVLALKVVLLDGVWRRPETHIMRQASGDASGTKVYPFEYPYLYSSEFGVRYLEVQASQAVPFRFVLYGHAAAPMVRIAGNVYQFNTTVPAGGHLIVDSLPSPSITLVDVDGARTDELSCAVRGTGEGCGTYAFEKIPPGTSEVVWSDMFGFDLTVYQERGDSPYAAGGTE